MAQTGQGLGTRGLISVVSATILVATQAITIAIAAGWAVGGLFHLGDIGEYGLMGVFSLLAIYVSVLYVRKAIIAETNAHY
ncbi:hypothetical protein [Azorhizobium sp. AG788]|uniref:hypothetical protein n=1 Tax=Azorhizobium sp. AG788 TaxID=2183897 RepID=UPI003138AE06